MADVDAGKAAIVRELLPEVELVEDAELRDKVIEVWVRAWELSGFARFEDGMMMGKSLRDSQAGLAHIRATARLSIDAARTLRDTFGFQIHVDYVAAGALLHDVCKQVEYIEPAAGTFRGDVLHHSITGAHLALQAGLPPEVAHIVAYHSALGDSVERSFECVLVHSVDEVMADAVYRRFLGKSRRQLHSGR
ncbi:MAG: HDIG domain-containing protein [Chloroflexi bacterium]|nr:HDIG domain-containing protein [Chloroflexota bacterium]